MLYCTVACNTDDLCEIMKLVYRASLAMTTVEGQSLLKRQKHESRHLTSVGNFSHTRQLAAGSWPSNLSFADNYCKNMTVVSRR